MEALIVDFENEIKFKNRGQATFLDWPDLRGEGLRNNWVTLCCLSSLSHLG